MKKKAFALRIDEKMLEEVESWARKEFRSTNGQIEWIINKALTERKRGNVLEPETKSPKSP
ncbi:MAG: Arc family DNA binding domain-containing protein [Bacteroidota bacterium]|nr:Arc family DNA binding domain-containing protein [Bacteroidota bacterium]MDX5404245.1 Arc family DNA binding domain-containing protein [Bacteroidota bacterium]MDX5428719.1 Arc family DNA binding domain-containing protein [Bacteroidota bacterium]MDX5448854.1 Arc family DNA binding domain-containing protein [Bacteroidota bacterium]MDX5506447.1 Arc family DNA binding domain-containing protein [Bacteroidota bacterium]